MEVVLWDDAQAKMLNAIQSNTMPDMNVVSDTSWSSAYLAGGIVEVDDIVEAIDDEYGFIDSTLSSYTADGHYWAVPIDSICYSLMYRPSALEAAGFTEPPKTWSELKEYAEKLTIDENGDGEIDQYGIEELLVPETLWRQIHLRHLWHRPEQIYLMKTEPSVLIMMQLSMLS